MPFSQESFSSLILVFKLRFLISIILFFISPKSLYGQLSDLISFSTSCKFSFEQEIIILLWLSPNKTESNLFSFLFISTEKPKSFSKLHSQRVISSPPIEQSFAELISLFCNGKKAAYYLWKMGSQKNRLEHLSF